METQTTANELKGRFSGLILDMDGVLYRGSQALPGARELFPALRAAGLSFILLTNNSTKSPTEYRAKLARMGIVVDPSAIFTSGVATTLYLMQHFPDGGGVYVLGDPALLTMLTALPGFRADGWQPKFVVVGLDFRLTYDSLQRACSAIRGGAHFIATNTDATIPVEGGELWPGAGSIVAALQICSGVDPVVMGKPNPYIGQMALLKLDLPPDKVLCVGDRLETDILLGARIGTPTALILTGVSRREDIDTAEAQPDYVFNNIPELMSALGLK
jgi:HAD superfamily hydrolase (TIGR01457 family)